jgi:hypothetical protein
MGKQGAYLAKLANTDWLKRLKIGCIQVIIGTWRRAGMPKSILQNCRRNTRIFLQGNNIYPHGQLVAHSTKLSEVFISSIQSAGASMEKE